MRVRVHAASVNFPDVLLVAGEYQIPVPPPFVPGSEFAGVVTEVADDVDDAADVGDRDHVFGSTLVGAFAEEVVVAATSLTRFRTAWTTGPQPRSASRIAPGTTCCARSRRSSRATSSSCSGRVAVSGWPRCNSGRRSAASVTAVASSDAKLAVAGRSARRCSSTIAAAIFAARCVMPPRRCRCRRRSRGGDLAEPALRTLHWGGRFVTVGYASGVIPRIPLNLVLLKGVQILGFQFLDFATHLPDELERNEQELLALLGSGRACPHIGASFALADSAAALRYVADGTRDRQGRPRRSGVESGALATQDVANARRNSRGAPDSGTTDGFLFVDVGDRCDELGGVEPVVRALAVEQLAV